MDKVHKTVSTNHNLYIEKGEPKRNRTEVPLLTSLTQGTDSSRFIGAISASRCAKINS